jgi:hypothetical protein
MGAATSDAEDTSSNNSFRLEKHKKLMRSFYKNLIILTGCFGWHWLDKCITVRVNAAFR